MNAEDLKTLFASACLGASIGWLLSECETSFNEYAVGLNSRDTNAIENGVHDPKAAKSFEQKLTEEFVKNGYEITVTAPEPSEASQPAKPKTDKPAP